MKLHVKCLPYCEINNTMGDSESFSSLMDLVNSHLSKTSLSASQSGDEGGSSFPLASVRIQTGLSQTRVFTPPNGIISIPRLGQDNEITGILAQQVTNMLIAKERKKQEDEKIRKLEEESKLQKQQKQAEDYDIDLMSSIVTPNLDQVLTYNLPDKRASMSSSMESLLAETKSLGQEEIEKKFDTLPLNQDMSYMLSRKVHRGRPSSFGKVMSSRIRPVAAPYVKVDVNNAAIRRFDFSTQSPCDINLEKRRNPPQDRYAHMNMVERFMAQTSNESVHHM